MWLLYIAISFYVGYVSLTLVSAFKYHNKPIKQFNAKPLFVITFAQVTLIPLMIKYF